MKHPLLSQAIRNMNNAGITIGLVMDVDEESGKVTIGTMTEELVQYDKEEVFPNGVSKHDRVIVTKCFIYHKTTGSILPPGWNLT